LADARWARYKSGALWHQSQHPLHENLLSEII
jgi:hypothetical protein